MNRAVLRGPLGPEADLTDDLSWLGVDGPVALVTAGWEEAERNDAHIDRLLGGGTRNLGLFGRRLDVLASDPEFAAALEAHGADLAEAQAAYRLRLGHALAAVAAIQRRWAGARRRIGTELDQAIQDVRRLDADHLAAVRDSRAAFAEAHPPEASDIVVAHRAAVREVLDGCAAIAIAGGHVSVLLECMRLCGVVDAASLPLLAWSSGCMAVGSRVLVIDDHDLARRPAELADVGLQVLSGIVPIPAAAARLDSDDADAMALLARRCAPDACVLLDDGDRIQCDEGAAPDLRTARVVGPDGGVRGAAEAA